MAAAMHYFSDLRLRRAIRTLFGRAIRTLFERAGSEPAEAARSPAIRWMRTSGATTATGSE